MLENCLVVKLLGHVMEAYSVLKMRNSSIDRPICYCHRLSMSGPNMMDGWVDGQEGVDEVDAWMGGWMSTWMGEWIAESCSSCNLYA